MGRTALLSNISRRWVVMTWAAGLMVCLFAVLSTVSTAQTRADAPRVIAGELSSPDWTFFNGPPLEINGDWEVIWGQLVEPGAFNGAYKGEYFELPGRWNGVNQPGMSGSYGTATFRTRLNLPVYNRELAFHLIAPHAAYRVYIDGILVANNGTVTPSAEDFQANYVSRTFPAQSGKSEIVFQVANFTHAYGGPGHALKLWDAQRLNRFLESLSVLYGLVLGVMVTIGLFHFILYLADRRSRTQSAIHFWFSILCFIIAYRVQGVIPFLHTYFPETNYWSDLRGSYLSLYAAPAVYLLFFRSVFREAIPQRLTLIFVYVCLAGVVFTLAAPQFYYTYTRNFSIFLNVAAIIYSLVFTVRAVMAQQAGAGVILISNFAFLLTALNDAFIYTDQGSGFDLTPFGILILGIGYSYALLLRLQLRFKQAWDTSHALERLNLDLEKQVRDRTRAFKAAAAKAEGAAEERARFIAAASHDLRQPLHALAMFNAALKGKITTPAHSKLIENQGAAIKNLGQLLQDTLDTARADHQQKTPEIKQVDVVALIGKITNGFALKAESQKIKLESSAGRGDIYTDHVMLQRVLGNLLDNALKVARTSAALTAKQQGDRWVFVIEDDGPGIEASDIGRIFDSYVTLDDVPPTAQGGYGLGLYVVKEFTRLLGGTINVDSDLGKGSRFEITLPHAPQGQALPPPKDKDTLQRPRLRSGTRVLVIDDEAVILEAMSALLGGWDCEVKSAPSLAAARETLSAGFQPDIMIVDYHLQGTTGLYVIAALSRALARPVPAIVITGATESGILAQIKQTGYPMLQKPIDPSELAVLLSSVLGD